MLPLQGFVDAESPLVRETIGWIRQELCDGPFIYRYLGEDGVGGPEGAFVLCGFWLAEALAQGGDLEAAQEVFIAHAEASNHLGLLAEEVHPGTGELLGNFPQGFSHLGLIKAACRIDRGLRMRDESGTKLPRTSLD